MHAKQIAENFLYLQYRLSRTLFEFAFGHIGGGCIMHHVVAELVTCNTRMKLNGRGGCTPEK